MLENEGKILALLIMISRLSLISVLVSNFVHQRRHGVNWGWLVNLGSAGYIGYVSATPFVAEEFMWLRVLGAYAILIIVYGLSTYAKKRDMRWMKRGR